MFRQTFCFISNKTEQLHLPLQLPADFKFVSIYNQEQECRTPNLLHMDLLLAVNLNFKHSFFKVIFNFVLANLSGGPPRRSAGQGHPQQMLRANHVHNHNHIHAELDSASISSSHFDIDWEAKEVHTAL